MKLKNAFGGLFVSVVLHLGVLAGCAQTNEYLFTGFKTNVTLNPGSYIITAYGAQGGYGAGGSGGLGAEMKGQFNFGEVTTVTLLVGGTGGGYARPGGGGGAGGGGGGSFVVNGSNPLVIAGGGGAGGGATAGGSAVTSPNGNGGGGGSGGTFGGGGGGGFSGGGTDGDGGTGHLGVDAGGGGSGFFGGGGGGSGTEFSGSGGYGGGGGGGYAYALGVNDGSGGGGGGYSGGSGGSGSNGGSGGGSYIDPSAITNLAKLSGIASPDGSLNGEIIITEVYYPPVITSQPTHVTASTGGTATFAVGISGAPPLKYQWQLNGTNISGATNAALTLVNVAATNLGFYSVTVTNVSGGTTSAPAGLFIVDPKILAGLIVTGPAGSNYDVQATATLANGGQWTTLTNLSLPAQPYTYIDDHSQTNPQQFYRLAITNAASHPTNGWGHLATLKLEQFTKLAVQWPAGSNYDLQSTPASRSVTNWTTLANVGLFPQPYTYVDYSSPTNPQSYRIVPGPAFSRQPLSTTVGSGGTAIFAPGVSNAPGFGYQWTCNGTNIAGATNLSLTLTNVSAANAGLYVVTILNGAAPVTSAAASLATVDLRTIAGLGINGIISTNYSVQSIAAFSNGNPWATRTNINLAVQPTIWIDYGSLTNPQQFYRLAVTNAPTPPPLELNLFTCLIINGPLGLNYNLQSLGNDGWTTLTNLNLPSQPYIFIDYNSPTNPQQSYRAAPQ